MDATTQFTPRDAARVLRVPEARIPTLSDLAGVGHEPGSGFTFQQLLLLRTTHGLLEAGVPERRVRALWRSLRAQLPGDDSLTRLRIVAEGDRAVAWDGNRRWEPDSGQVELEFGGGPAGDFGGAGDDDDGGGGGGGDRERGAREVGGRENGGGGGGDREGGGRENGGRASGGREGGAAEAKDGRGAAPLALSIPSPAGATAVAEEPALGAADWFQLAVEMESSSADEARRAYRRALEADSRYADAHLNLGRLEHEAGELGRAEAHYRDAVRCDPEDPTAHFNLGVLLEDRNRPDEAILAYRQAIVRDPELADAHYNLGLLLESRGQRGEAMKHLMTARGLYDRASGE